MDPTSTLNTLLPTQAQNILSNPRVQQGAHQLAQMGSAFYFSHLGIFEFISVIVSGTLIAATVFFIIKTGWLAVRIDRVEDVILKADTPKRKSLKTWGKVQQHFFQGDENSLKLALLEADKILDEALRLAGIMGENLGDRLKKINESQLPNLQDIWEAHKLRNRLAHEQDFKLNRNTAERALAIYEQAFKDLGLLDQ